MNASWQRSISMSPALAAKAHAKAKNRAASGSFLSRIAWQRDIYVTVIAGGGWASSSRVYRFAAKTAAFHYGDLIKSIEVLYVVYRGRLWSAAVTALIAFEMVDHFHFLASAILRTSYVAEAPKLSGRRFAGIDLNYCSHLRCNVLLPGVTAFHAS
uniref:Uncharacterized protein n=1 Tax=Lygus hesperus TaxID=30085 RepID=A0A146LER0_LYGHE